MYFLSIPLSSFLGNFTSKAVISRRDKYHADIRLVCLGGRENFCCQLCACISFKTMPWNKMASTRKGTKPKHPLNTRHNCKSESDKGDKELTLMEYKSFVYRLF